MKAPRLGMKLLICDAVNGDLTTEVSSLSMNPPGAVEAWARVMKEERMNKEMNRTGFNMGKPAGRVKFISTSLMQG